MEIKIKLKTPKISSFSLQISIVFILLTIIAVQAGVLLSAFEINSRNTLANYENPKAHLELARIAGIFGDQELANIELKRAYDFIDHHEEKNIAGFSTEFDEINKITNWEKYLEAKIKNWEDILEKQPGYRDAYLELSLLYFQKNNLNKAVENFKIAHKIDPNNYRVKEVRNFLEIEGLFKEG